MHDNVHVLHIYKYICVCLVNETHCAYLDTTALVIRKRFLINYEGMLQTENWPGCCHISLGGISRERERLENATMNRLSAVNVIRPLL